MFKIMIHNFFKTTYLMSIMSSSYDRVFNVSKRQDIRRRGGSGVQVLVRTIYHIITKVFNCQKNKL